MLWSHGFHWGFKSYQHLYVNCARFDIDLATMDFGRVLVPDALEVSPHGYHPAPFLPLGPDGPKIDPFDDEDENVVTGPSSQE